MNQIMYQANKKQSNYVKKKTNSEERTSSLNSSMNKQLIEQTTNEEVL